MSRHPRTANSLAFAAIAAYCSAKGYPEPEPEVRFHPGRRWRWDCGWGPPVLLAVEIHGGVFRGGRHTRGAGFTRDREKVNAGVVLGWRVLEITTGQLAAGELWPMLDILLSGTPAGTPGR